MQHKVFTVALSREELMRLGQDWQKRALDRPSGRITVLEDEREPVDLPAYLAQLGDA